MTQDAGALLKQLADDVVREMHSVLTTKWDRDCLHAKTLNALYRAQAASQGNGRGEERSAVQSREVIARIVAKELGEDFDKLVDFHFVHDTFCQDDFYRVADAILAPDAAQSSAVQSELADRISDANLPAIDIYKTMIRVDPGYYVLMPSDVRDKVEHALRGVAQAVPEPYQKGYRDGYETAREDNKLREPDLVALYAFVNAYGSQDSFTEGLDRAVKLARDAIAIYDFKKSEAVAVPSADREGK